MKICHWGSTHHSKTSLHQSWLNPLTLKIQLAIFPSDHHTKGESWLLYFDDALWLPTLSVLISYLQYNILESQWEVTCGSHLAVKRFKGKKILKNLRWFFSQCKVPIQFFFSNLIQFWLILTIVCMWGK